MSAYSGGIPLACSTVTRKVKMLPTSSWPARPSPQLSFVSAMLPSLRSEESHMGVLGAVVEWCIETDLYTSCIWILSSRPIPAHCQLDQAFFTFLHKEGYSAPVSLILLSSSEGVMTSELWPWPSTMRSSSRDRPDRVITVEGKSYWLDTKEGGHKSRGGIST